MSAYSSIFIVVTLSGAQHTLLPKLALVDWGQAMFPDLFARVSTP
jgi:hypothetical protein